MKVKYIGNGGVSLNGVGKLMPGDVFTVDASFGKQLIKQAKRFKEVKAEAKKKSKKKKK